MLSAHAGLIRVTLFEKKLNKNIAITAERDALHYIFLQNIEFLMRILLQIFLMQILRTKNVKFGLVRFDNYTLYRLSVVYINIDAIIRLVLGLLGPINQCKR